MKDLAKRLGLKIKGDELRKQLNNDLSTNGGYVAHMLRLGHAADAPTGLILLGPVACGVAAVVMPHPLVVGGVAAGIGYLVIESLLAKDKKIRDSYRDPSTLLDGTTQDDRMTLISFFASHPADKPCVMGLWDKGGNPAPAQGQAPQQQGEATQPNPKAEGEAPPAPLYLENIEIPHWRRQILLSAAQREGKSNLIRVLMAQQCEAGSTVKIHYMSSKISDTIPPHWNGHLIAGSLDELRGRLEELIDEWQDIFQRHAKGDATELEWLIFDELLYFQQIAKPVKALRDKMNALIVSLATQGSSCNLGSVLIAQTENAGELGISEDILRKNFVVISPARSKHGEALRSIEKLVRGREAYHPETKRVALAMAKQQHFSAFLAMDSEVLSVYHPPEYQGELKPLEPVLVGGNVLLEAVRSKVGHQPQTASDINRSFPSQNRPGSDAIQGVLDKLVEDGEVEAVEGGKATKYRVKSLPPTAPPSPIVLPIRGVA